MTAYCSILGGYCELRCRYCNGRDGKMYIRNHLEEEDQKLYDRVSDILGPIGTPALDKLLEAVWLKAQEENQQYS